jgi:hypothetical protein
MSTIELDHHALSIRLRLAVAERTDQPPAVVYCIQPRNEGIELVTMPGLNWMLDSLTGEGADLSSALAEMAAAEYSCPLDHSAPEHGGLAGIALRLRGTGVSTDAPPEYLAFLAALHTTGADLSGMPGTMRVHSCLAICADGTAHHTVWLEDEPDPYWAIERPGDEPHGTGPTRDALERLWAATAHCGEPLP